jgi:hypothetical protein
MINDSSSSSPATKMCHTQATEQMLFSNNRRPSKVNICWTKNIVPSSASKQACRKRGCDPSIFEKLSFFPSRTENFLFFSAGSKNFPPSYPRKFIVFSRHWIARRLRIILRISGGRLDGVWNLVRVELFSRNMWPSGTRIWFRVSRLSPTIHQHCKPRESKPGRVFFDSTLLFFTYKFSFLHNFGPLKKLLLEFSDICGILF